MIINFSRIEDPDFSPFDLGNINIVKDAIEFRSDEEDRYAMMIFISISDFIHGLLACYRGEKKRFEFVGTDSSFSIVFSKKDGNIQLSRQKKTIECSWREALESTMSGINKIIKENKLKIDWGHAVFSDLNGAKMELEKTLSELR